MKANQELPRSRQVLEKIPIVGAKFRRSREEDQAKREKVREILGRSIQQRERDEKRRETLRNAQHAVEEKFQGSIEAQLPDPTHLSSEEREKIKAEIGQRRRNIGIQKVWMSDSDSRNPQTRAEDVKVIQQEEEAIRALEDQLYPRHPKPVERAHPRPRLSDNFRESQPSTASNPPTPDKPTGNS